MFMKSPSSYFARICAMYETQNYKPLKTCLEMYMVGTLISTCFINNLVVVSGNHRQRGVEETLYLMHLGTFCKFSII